MTTQGGQAVFYCSAVRASLLRVEKEEGVLGERCQGQMLAGLRDDHRLLRTRGSSSWRWIKEDSTRQ